MLINILSVNHVKKMNPLWRVYLTIEISLKIQTIKININWELLYGTKKAYLTVGKSINVVNHKFRKLKC